MNQKREERVGKSFVKLIKRFKSGLKSTARDSIDLCALKVLGRVCKKFKMATAEGDFVHQCIEQIGFGTFQFLSLSIVFMRAFTFGSMTSVVAIVQPFLRCQMQLTAFEASWIITAENFARIFSSVFIGKTSDIYGRRRTIILSTFMHVFAAVLNSLSSSLTMIVVTRAAIGIAYPSRAATFAYALETLPASKRKYLSLARGFTISGSLFGMFVGITTLQYLNWRWFILLAEGVPSIMTFILACCLTESARFLQEKGRHQEAISVLENIALMNGKDPEIVRCLYNSTVEVSKEDEEVSLSRLEILHRVLVICVFFYTAAVLGTVVNYGSMQFADNPNLISCGDCAHQLKYGYRWAYEISSFLAIFWTIFLLIKCERIVAIRWSFVISIPSLIPFYWNIEQWTLLVSLSLCTLLSSPLLLVGSIYEGELLPTKYRSLGMGVATSVGYFGMTCGGFLSAYVYHESRYICFGAIHIMLLAAAAVSFSVSWKTKDKALKDK